MRKVISYGFQTIEEDDIDAVVRTLRSGMLTQGPVVEAFEQALREYTGARYAVVCANGTAALHLACLAGRICSGEGVLTSPVTFLASGNCAVYVGARPVLADIDSITANISPDEIEKKLDAFPDIKAVVPVHFAGLPCDMRAISEIALRRHLMVIEDGCHALGAEWRGPDGRWHKVGDCAMSDMTVFSFHPVKAITTGEGGAITTNDHELYLRLKLLRSHGITKDTRAFMRSESAPWSYEMHEAGFNYRLSDIQCALGISQLGKIDRFMARRRKIAALYDELFSEYRFMKTPASVDGLRSAYHLYPLRIDFDAMGVSKAEWFKAMSALGINLQVHYIPIHMQPFYQEIFKYRDGDFPVSEKFYREEVSMPIYPLLTDNDVHFIVDCVLSTLGGAFSGFGRDK